MAKAVNTWRLLRRAQSSPEDPFACGIAFCPQSDAETAGQGRFWHKTRAQRDRTRKPGWFHTAQHPQGPRVGPEEGWDMKGGTRGLLEQLLVPLVCPQGTPRSRSSAGFAGAIPSTGSLPQARVINGTRDQRRDSQGERSPKDTHCSPSSESFRCRPSV